MVAVIPSHRFNNHAGKGAPHALPILGRKVFKVAPQHAVLGRLTLSQDRIDQARRGTLARGLRQLDGIIHHRALRNPFQKPNLVSAHAENRQHFGIEPFHASSRKLLDLEVQFAAPTQHAHHEFGREPPVGLLQGGNLRALQQIHGEAAAGFQAQQDLVGDFSSGGNGHGRLEIKVRLEYVIA